MVREEEVGENPCTGSNRNPVAERRGSNFMLNDCLSMISCEYDSRY